MAVGIRNSPIIVLLALLLFSFTGDNKSGADLSSKEKRLYSLINQYRVKKGLSKIALSNKLTKVAQLHCQDLEENYKFKSNCNLHSWSNDSSLWNGCCYTSDHEKASCMWDKPKEITGYSGSGFEIAYFNTANFKAEAALKAWIKSKGHHKVIINGGIWKSHKWKAIGIGASDNFACVWFGKLSDTSK
jgi:uncharacterized protein YkwD